MSFLKNFPNILIQNILEFNQNEYIDPPKTFNRAQFLSNKNLK